MGLSIRHDLVGGFQAWRTWPQRLWIDLLIAVLNDGSGVEVALVGVGEGVQVLLGGLDLGVAHAFHDGLEVGAAGEQPGGVGVAQVVDPDGEVDAAGLDGG